MVRVGSFSVELINAETMQMFQEHQHASHHYVEIEPNAQYWVRVYNHLETKCKCKLEVDGNELGSGFSVRGGDFSDNGASSRVDMINAKRALQVKKAIESRRHDAARGFWIGSVKVKFYNAIRTEERWHNACENRQSSWQRGDAPRECSSDGKKAVVSSLGTIEHTSHAKPGIYTLYARGEWLQTIELHYCTAVGLIHVGVLPKPPAWDYQRMIFPSAKLNSKCANIKPEIKSIQTLVDRVS
jgi:hypothetical protein